MKYLSALLVIATLAACSSPTGPEAGLKSGANTTAESRYILISGLKKGPTTAESRFILISGLRQAPQAPQAPKAESRYILHSGVQLAPPSQE